MTEDKLAARSSAMLSFLEQEAFNVLPLEVKKHTTCNRMLASVLSPCCCTQGSGKEDPAQCSIHRKAPVVVVVVGIVVVLVVVLVVIVVVVVGISCC